MPALVAGASLWAGVPPSGLLQRAWHRARNDRWIVPKLAFLALVATPETYAIYFTARNESWPASAIAPV